MLFNMCKNKIFKAQQTQENCEYIKQNGHATMEEVRNHCDAGSDVKADDDLGFDPFHETQKALAELLEDEMQVQQQKMFQQQQQQREREEQTRVQHQQSLASLNQQHFPQVNIVISKRIFLFLIKINMIYLNLIMRAPNFNARCFFYITRCSFHF